MNGDEVHAFFGMGTYHFKEVLSADVGEVFLEISHGVIHGHSADHRGRFFDERAAEVVCLSVVRKVHDGFSAIFERHVDLFHFAIVIAHVA